MPPRIPKRIHQLDTTNIDLLSTDRIPVDVYNLDGTWSTFQKSGQQIINTIINQLPPLNDGGDVSGQIPLFFVDLATIIALPSVTYNNGLAGVGATLTSNTNMVLPLIDNVAGLLGQTVLVKNQANKIQNGIYEITDLGSNLTPFILTRVDFNDETTEIYPSQVNVQYGLQNTNKYFLQKTENPIVGTDIIEYRLAPNPVNVPVPILFADTITDTILPNSPTYTSTTTIPNIPGYRALLTATTNGAFPMLNNVPATINMRVLINGQVNQAHNGYYILINKGSATTKWILQRADAWAVNIYPKLIYIHRSICTKHKSFYTSLFPISNAQVGTNPISYEEIDTNEYFEITNNRIIPKQIFDNDIAVRDDKGFIIENDELLSPTPLVTSANYVWIIFVNNKFYISDYSQYVYVLDDNFNLITTLNADGAFALSYNSNLNRLYVGSYQYDTLHYIDVLTDTVTTVNNLGVFGLSDVLEYNPVTNKVYGYDYSNERVLVFDEDLIYLNDIKYNIATGYSIFTLPFPTDAIDGIHTNLPTLTLSGIGIGLTFDIEVIGGNIISMDINNNGSGYINGDFIAIDLTSVGGTNTGSFPVSVDVEGWYLGININNGDIYTVGRNAAIIIYDINENIVKVHDCLNFKSSFTSTYTAFEEWPEGIAFNSSNNKMYISNSQNLIYVIDGNTREIDTILDINPLVLSGTAQYVSRITYSEGKILVTLGWDNSNTGIIIEIDDLNNMTLAPLIYSVGQNLNTAILANGYYAYHLNFPFTQTVYDAPPSPIKYTEKIQGGLSTDNRVHQLQDKSGTLAHLDDIPPPQVFNIPVNRTLYVDPVNGNNATGVIGDMSKPFQTIYGITLAIILNGLTEHLVYFRAGDYSGQVLELQNTISYYFEPGSKINSITNTGTSSGSYSNVYGYVDIVTPYSGYTASIYLTGNNKKYYIECNSIESLNNSIILTNNSGPTSFLELTLKSKTVKNYAGLPIQIVNLCKLYYNVDNIYCQNGININSYRAEVYINYDNINPLTDAEVISKIGFVPSTTYRGKLINNQITISPFGTSTSKVKFKGRIINWDWQNGGTYSLFDNLNFPMDLKINSDIYLSSAIEFIRWTGSVRSKFTFEGKTVMYTNSRPFYIDHIGDDSNYVILKNSEFIYYGNAGHVIRFFRGNLELYNTKIIRVLDGGYNNESLIYKFSSDTHIYSKNVEFIIYDPKLVFSNDIYCIDSVDIPSGEVHFSNTRSNVDNSPNITDIAVVSGFIANDINLKTFDIEL